VARNADIRSEIVLAPVGRHAWKLLHFASHRTSSCVDITRGRDAVVRRSGASEWSGCTSMPRRDKRVMIQENWDEKRARRT